MKISEKILRMRNENDMTQVEFGKIAGVTDKAVSTWERGEKEPRMKPLQKICSYFNIDINQFVDSDSDVYKKATPESEGSGNNDLITAQIIEIIHGMSESEKLIYLENLKTLELQNKRSLSRKRS